MGIVRDIRNALRPAMVLNRAMGPLSMYHGMMKLVILRDPSVTACVKEEGCQQDGGKTASYP
jgi:hypothetical protein